MKKIILIFLLLHSSTCFSMAETKLVEATHQDAKPKATHRNVSKIVLVAKGINNVLNDVLTPKGAIKALVLLSPAIIFYCKYYNYSPLKLTVENGVNLIGYAKERYKIQEAIGKSAASAEIMTKEPKRYLFITLNGFIDKMISSGVPFLTGLLATRFISGKR